MDRIKELQSAKSLIERLKKVMLQEQAVFVSTDLSKLDELIIEKQLLIDQTSKLEMMLTEVSESETKSKIEKLLLGEIKILLTDCRELNRESNQLTTHRASMIGKSISYLESLLNIDTVKLYDPSGRTSNKSGKRDFGLA